MNRSETQKRIEELEAWLERSREFLKVATRAHNARAGHIIREIEALAQKEGNK